MSDLRGLEGDHVDVGHIWVSRCRLHVYVCFVLEFSVAGLQRLAMSWELRSALDIKWLYLRVSLWFGDIMKNCFCFIQQRMQQL